MRRQTSNSVKVYGVFALTYMKIGDGEKIQKLLESRANCNLRQVEKVYKVFAVTSMEASDGKIKTGTFRIGLVNAHDQVFQAK